MLICFTLYLLLLAVHALHGQKREIGKSVLTSESLGVGSKNDEAFLFVYF